MNSETIIGALIAALIGMFTAVMALLVADGISSIGDIAQLSWIVVGIGALISFLKDYQAINTRKAIAKLTGSGES